MKRKDSVFVWSDGWYIEQDKAWFIGGKENILFCLDLKTCVCEYAVDIPEAKRREPRQAPRCIKFNEDIFCLPERCNSIWVYSLRYKNFIQIKVANPSEHNIELRSAWKFDDKIFAVSYTLGQVIEINLIRKEIVDYYKFDGIKGEIADTIREGNKIYSLYESGKIFEFDMVTKEIIVYEFPDIGRKFSTLCFWGDKFWLSGYCKELYVWDKRYNTIAVIDGFPDDFGLYDYGQDTDGKADCRTEKYERPAFLYSIAAEGKIWFIPFQTNQIIFADRDSGKLCAFEIMEETETRESILEKELCAKYVLEYVMDERYIGLFSVKNRKILEVDARRLTYRWREYSFSNQCIRQCIEIYSGILQENCLFDQYLLYNNMSDYGNAETSNSDRNSIGVKIYQSILNTLTS